MKIEKDLFYFVTCKRKHTMPTIKVSKMRMYDKKFKCFKKLSSGNKCLPKTNHFFYVLCNKEKFRTELIANNGNRCEFNGLVKLNECQTKG